MPDFAWGFIVGGVVVSIPWYMWYRGNLKPKLDAWKLSVKNKLGG